MESIDNATKNKLKQTIEKIEKLEEEKAAIAQAIKDTWYEAEHFGFNVKVLKKVLKLRKMDKSKLEEEDILVDLYRSALDL